MLDFHLGINGVAQPGPHLGGLDMGEMDRLERNGFLLKSDHGHFPDPEESIPYFEDTVLNADQVKLVYARFSEKLKQVESTGGFYDPAVEKLGAILKAAVESDNGISTIAD